jgi:hypothetical protein
MLASVTEDNPALPYLPEVVAGLGVILVLAAIVGLIVLFVRKLRRIEQKVDALGAERSGSAGTRRTPPNRPPRARESGGIRPSHVVDGNDSVDCSCCLFQVTSIRSHHGVAASKSPFRDGEVDRVIESGCRRQNSHGTRLRLGEGSDCATP